MVEALTESAAVGAPLPVAVVGLDADLLAADVAVTQPVGPPARCSARLLRRKLWVWVAGFGLLSGSASCKHGQHRDRNSCKMKTH